MSYLLSVQKLSRYLISLFRFWFFPFWITFDYFLIRLFPEINKFTKIHFSLLARWGHGSLGEILQKNITQTKGNVDTTYFLWAKHLLHKHNYCRNNESQDGHRLRNSLNYDYDACHLRFLCNSPGSRCTNSGLCPTSGNCTGKKC